MSKRLTVACVIVAGTFVIAAPPPLKVDKSAPLLLDDPATAAKPAAAAPRIICHDCHGNFREELLSVTHAKVDVTCVTCHGESRAHADDEDNTTPPQVMYLREAIGKKCGECHKKHNSSAAKVVARWQERGLQNLKPADLACTDCHGKHRVNVRTIHWDKKTGKLLDAPKKTAK